MTARIARDPFALSNAEVLRIFRAAEQLVRYPRRESEDFLDLLEAVDAADGQDALADRISDLRRDLGLDTSECLACGKTRCSCDIRFTEAREARSSFGMGGKAVGL